MKEKNFSDSVAQEIDLEVRKIIHECLDEAREIVSENKHLLDNIANYLLKVETLNKNDIDEIEKTGKLSWYDDEESEASNNKVKVEEEKSEETSDDKDEN